VFVRASEGLGAGLAPATLGQVAAKIRVMNSYYSNRIEGNNTRPRVIEAALAGSFDEDPRRRALQRESAAHVRLHAEIDRRASAGELEDPSTSDFIRWLHREFYRDVDPAALVLREATTDGAGVIVIKPGEWRDGDVDVGDHVPPSHNYVLAFMDHFHKRFRQDGLHGQTTKILAMATRKFLQHGLRTRHKCIAIFMWIWNEYGAVASRRPWCLIFYRLAGLIDCAKFL
jgi:Fic family protein